MEEDKDPDPRFSHDPDPEDSEIPSWLSRVEDDEPEPPPKMGKWVASLFVLGGAAFIILAIYAPKFVPGLRLGSDPDGEVQVSTPTVLPTTPPAFPESSTAPKPKKATSIKTFTPVDVGAEWTAKGARWRLQGSLFELGTNQPAKGAVAVFQDPKTRQRYRASADAKGRYRASLPVNEDGYLLAIWHKRGFKTYVEDWLPSLQTLPKAKRADVAKSLTDSFEQEKLYGTQGQRIKKDFAIGPPMSIKTAEQKAEEVSETAEPEEDGEAWNKETEEE